MRRFPFLERKKDKQTAFVINWVGIRPKEGCGVWWRGKKILPPLQLFLPSPPWSLFSRYVTLIEFEFEFEFEFIVL